LAHAAPLRFDVSGARSGLRLGEKAACFVAVVGVLGDQVSTRLGLMRPGVSESNPFASWLMVRGLWLPFDLALLSFTVLASFVSARAVGPRERWLFLLAPVVFGVVRLVAAVWNFLLFAI